MSSKAPSPLELRLTIAEVAAFLDDAFPAEARRALGQLDSVALNHVRMKLDPDATMTRPGGIVSGPVLMGLVDVAAYAVIAAHHGPEPMAVTNTSPTTAAATLSVTFLRATRVEPVFADARILKLGRRLATIDVRLWQGAEDRLVAQSTVGYALP